MICNHTPADLGLEQLVAEQWQQPLSPKILANISEFYTQYCEIQNDNINLIWLLTIMLHEEVQLPRGEVVSAMKQRLLDEDCLTPKAWRYIANGTSEDFRIAIDSEDPGDEPNWRWKTLIYWLQILSGLQFKSSIPPPIQYLFLHDSLLILPELDEVQFRGAWMSFGTLRHIINEAIKQLGSGLLERFIETELVEVITWLSTVDLNFDSNQMKKGWTYLAREASEWKADVLKKAIYESLIWNSALNKFHIAEWTIVPIDDAWSLHRLALTQRHCGDSFIAGCINGSERILVINNAEGKTSATLRLTNLNGLWSLGDIKGFANSKVSTHLQKLGEAIASKCNE